MKKITFQKTIDASPAQVWEVLWNDVTYPKWTAVFSETSRAITDWEKGSKVLFVDESSEGMVSLIEEKLPGKFMSFKHVGMVKDGVEDVYNEAHKDWQGALENYTLSESDGKTDLLVELDVTEEYEHHFQEKWPKAMDAIKELSEEKA